MRTTKVLLFLNKFILGAIVLFFPGIFIYLFGFVFYSGFYLEAQQAKTFPSKECESAIENMPSVFNGKTAKGFSYSLKTPLNYESEKAWPLLIVFSPSVNASIMERYTGLTGSVTEAGFVIAYVDSVRMNIETIKSLVEIVDDIEKNFCIDKERVYLTGHSDGATISQALNLFPETRNYFSGFISSAGGFRESDLETFECSENKNVMLLQNEGDSHFKGFSSSALNWWLSCNACNEKNRRESDGCVYYQECANGRLVFCEQPGNHLSWPRRHKEIVEFISDYSGF